VSQSPEHTEDGQEQDNYFSAFNELARRIRDGASFSGRERHCAFLNTGDGSFADVSAVSGFNLPSDGRGMALTDWDHDGDLDVWLSNRSAPRLQFLQNSIPASGARWVSFRLQGDPSKQCPRDAIGSQVEVVLAGSSGRRVKTLHAGNGLMSQSSKWLHFGLGPDAQIESVRVRWSGPGDVREVFNAVQPGQRWHLRQGSGSAQAAEVRPKVHLAPTPMELPTPTELARIRLSQPLQIPKLIYEDFTGARQDLAEISKERAILVNLWATWCVPCAGELKAFANAKSRFAAEGMEVIALNVDHLNPDTKVTPAQAAAMLRNYGFSMRGGMANPELVALLEQSILKSVYRHREMPVPISFLIDRGGWLSAIYKGPVDVEQVIADRKKLGLSPESAKAAAVPFAGTWSQHHFPANPIAIAAAYLEGSYLEDARAELTKFLLENSAPPGNPAVPAAKKLNRQLGDIHLQLAEIALLEERPLEAKVSFQKSLTYNPRQIPALNKLAWLLATSTEDMVRDGAEALKHASFMMQAPGMAENPSLLGTLAAAHAAAGNFQEATRTTDRLIAILDGNGMTEQAKTHRLRRKRFQAGEALSR
jgi:thiol-disulfide isomerase/thioredoxin